MASAPTPGARREMRARTPGPPGWWRTLCPHLADTEGPALGQGGRVEQDRVHQPCPQAAYGLVANTNTQAIIESRDREQECKGLQEQSSLAC